QRDLRSFPTRRSSDVDGGSSRTSRFPAAGSSESTHPGTLGHEGRYGGDGRGRVADVVALRHGTAPSTVRTADIPAALPRDLRSMRQRARRSWLLVPGSQTHHPARRRDRGPAGGSAHGTTGTGLALALSRDLPERGLAQGARGQHWLPANPGPVVPEPVSQR